MFLKERKYIENKLVRHIYDNLSDFTCSFDDSDEEKILKLTAFYRIINT